LRTGLALGLAFAVSAALPMVVNLTPSMFWLGVSVGGLVGYLIPGFYIDRRIKNNRDEHRAGFPDFLDLLVVCAVRFEH
jgi:tight adherence protein C